MKEISALNLRKKFGEVLDEVRYRKEPWIIKKNGRAVVVIMDIETFNAAQDNLKDEAFIEDYADERIKDFLAEDKLDPSTLVAAKKALSK